MRVRIRIIVRDMFIVMLREPVKQHTDYGDFYKKRYV